MTRVYKIKNGLLIEKDGAFYVSDHITVDDIFQDQDVELINDESITITKARATALISSAEAPIRSQEIWAAGVTYFKSKDARMEESKTAGGGDFYDKVYDADRPELFYKSNAQRVSGPGEAIRVRKDSDWNVPEPELTLCVSPSGQIIGYTIGNDVSSRDIEGENPLYLPQAKTYDGSASIGPCLVLLDSPIEKNTKIEMTILRKNKPVFYGATDLSLMKRKLKDLVNYLYLECSFPHGCFLMTGTGIIPPDDFSLRTGDKVSIKIEPVGVLENVVD